MDAFEAEGLRQHAFDFLSSSSSPKQILYVLKNYYSILLSDTSELIAGVFITEFIDEFLESANKFEVFYAPPRITDEVLEILNKLKQYSIVQSKSDKIEHITEKLNRRSSELKSILNGRELNRFEPNKLYFPLLEKHSSPDYSFYWGTLETFTITIKKNKHKNNFILVPTPEFYDPELNEQVDKSWDIAISYLKKYDSKISEHHTVIIKFDHLIGNYTGISLGAALTISFIEELIGFYNFPFIISIRNNIAVTGGFDDLGNLIPLDRIIIDRKLEVVFYSPVKTFVVPAGNRASVENILTALKAAYPQRNLEVVEIKSLKDLLNRRNLVDIKRHNPIKRSLRYALNNWVVCILILIILGLTGHFYELINNYTPNMFSIVGNNLLVDNKNGNTLWSKKLDIDERYVPEILNYYSKIIYVNDDKNNEVLLCRLSQSDLKNKKEYGSIFCFNYQGKELWHYKFKDTVNTYGESLEPFYDCYIIDTIFYNGKNILIAGADNGPSFSSAIFQIDLSTGKRTGTTFWNPGHIDEGFIKNLPDKEKVIVFAGWNNGYEKALIGGIKLDSLSGYAPSTHYYTFKGMRPAKLLFYNLIPKTDYLKHFNVLRQSGIYPGSLIDSNRENKIIFTIMEKNSNEASLCYKIDYNFKNISIVVLSNFRIERDSLVAHGILRQPYTDTPEYRNLLEDQILYWNGKKFISHKMMTSNNIVSNHYSSK